MCDRLAHYADGPRGSIPPRLEFRGFRSIRRYRHSPQGCRNGFAEFEQLRSRTPCLPRYHLRCTNRPPPGGGRGRGAAGPTWYAEGGQVFDNLYLLTKKTNSAWAVNTSAGIILIDTLFGYAAQDEIVDGLKRVGLDPANIKYIVVSHAHGDHDGSVKFLQDTYNPRIIMGPKDWDLAAREANPPRRDLDATDGQKLTLGDTTITMYITPGHTAGTLSVLVPVKDHGVPHLAMEWGGTALGANTSREMLQSYISNAGRFMDIAEGAGADVIIVNHTEYNDAWRGLTGQKRGNPATRTRGWSVRLKSGIISLSCRNAPSLGSQSATGAPENKHRG